MFGLFCFNFKIFRFILTLEWDVIFLNVGLILTEDLKIQFEF